MKNCHELWTWRGLKAFENSPGDIAVARRWTVFCILFSHNHGSTAYTCTANRWNITHQAWFTVCITTAKLSEFSSVGEQTVSNYWGLWGKETENSLLFLNWPFAVIARIVWTIFITRFIELFMLETREHV